MNQPKLSLVMNTLNSLIVFGVKQAYASLFGGLLLGLMVVTHFYYPIEALHRYDFIFLSACLIQVVFLAVGWESMREVAVVMVFHLVATVMELFKTSDAIGSWHYPEAYIFGIAGVPLFTGFMYSAVGSYIVRSWQIMEFEFSTFPNKVWLLVLGILVYLNFFTHHFIWDFRWVLIVATFALFGTSKIYFKVRRRTFYMPIVVAQLLFTFFVWIAENVCTFANVWLYPSQTGSWQLVSFGKFTSWFLLVLLSFALVALTQQPKLKDT